jgi:hypothetical protein
MDYTKELVKNALYEYRKLRLQKGINIEQVNKLTDQIVLIEKTQQQIKQFLQPYKDVADELAREHSITEDMAKE